MLFVPYLSGLFWCCVRALMSEEAVHLDWCTLLSVSLINFPPLLQSGMTVEVLGTVIGTAIQGQIVGMANAPCVPVPGDFIEDLNSSSNVTFLPTTTQAVNVTQPIISLQDTVHTHRHTQTSSSSLLMPNCHLIANNLLYRKKSVKN